ncbi:MAG: 50S ribosomal protein L5 [Parcubacteria group bacterium]
MTPRLYEKYKKEVIPAMVLKFGYASVMAVPKISKVTVNIGVGRFIKEKKILEHIEKDLATLTGQKPSVRKARKSIAGFKVREGMPVGYMATLRGARMYDFIDRLISIALPRSRDFRGIESKNIDAQGSLNLGVREHSIFPEISYESLKDIFSLQINVTTTAKTRGEGLELLKLMGFPIREPEEK